MRKGASGPVKPNHQQAGLLKQIARSRLIKQYDADRGVRFYIDGGPVVPTPTAQLLIRNGWLKAQRDGLGFGAMFEDSQSYVVLTP